MSKMFRVLNRAEVEDLKWELHSHLPGSAKIYHILSNNVDNLLRGFEVIVDEWPVWTCIILRPESIDQVPDYFRHYYMCHTKSIKDFKFFIQRPGVIDWTKPAVLTGVPYDAVPLLQEKSKRQGGQLTSVEHRFMYAWMKPDPPEPASLPKDLKLTVLNESHAETIKNHWKHYRTNGGLLDYFREVIKNFDNSAITTEDGSLIAYICMQYNGSMANLFVDPKYHGHNLGVILLRDLTRILLSKNQTAYGFIKTKDTAFIATCQSIGFSWVPQGSMSWIHYRPLSCVAAFSPPANTLSSAVDEANIETGSDADIQDLFLNALPLSCNECSGIPADKTKCIHVGIN